MAELKITVCDRCGALERSVRRYTVITDRRSVDLDLCEEHGRPLELVVGLIAETRPTLHEISTLLQDPGGPDVVVAPVDELAARKRSHEPKP